MTKKTVCLNDKLKKNNLTKIVFYNTGAIILSLKKMKYYKLDRQGVFVWKLLERYNYPQKVIEVMINKYEFENKSEIKEDVINICNFLVSHQLWNK
ncbi:MAG: PqqD family protein [bacterium]